MGAFETTTVNNFSGLGQNNQQFKALDVPDTTEDLLFAGYHQFADGTTNDTTGNSVSASTNGLVVLNNSMDDGDTLRIDFVNDVTVTDEQQQHLQLYDALRRQNFQFTIVQVNGSPPPRIRSKFGCGSIMQTTMILPVPARQHIQRRLPVIAAGSDHGYFDQRSSPDGGAVCRSAEGYCTRRFSLWGSILMIRFR